MGRRQQITLGLKFINSCWLALGSVLHPTGNTLNSHTNHLQTHLTKLTATPKLSIDYIRRGDLIYGLESLGVAIGLIVETVN